MGSERVKGHLDLVLLGILAQQPSHGYEVMTALRERTGGVLDLPEGAVYPALHRLEDRGLLASDWLVVSGRRRRVYRLTREGARALAAETTDWQRLAGAIDTVLRPARLAEGLA